RHCWFLATTRNTSGNAVSAPSTGTASSFDIPGIPGGLHVHQAEIISGRIPLRSAGPGAAPSGFRPPHLLVNRLPNLRRRNALTMLVDESRPKGRNIRIIFERH